MPEQIIVSDSNTLSSTIERVVKRAMLQCVPDAIREANKPEWMDRDKVEENYSLTPRQLTYMRNNGRIEFTQHGRRILYKRESLEKWIEEGRVKARSGPAAEED